MVPAKWKEEILGDIVIMHSGGTPSKQRLEYWNGSIPWLSAKDLKSFRLSDSIEKISNLAVSSGTKVVSANTILILVRGMTLLKDVPIGVTTCTVAFNQDVRAIIPKKGIDSFFLAYSLLANKNNIKRMVNTSGHGTGRLESDLFRDLTVLIPPYAEQLNIVKVLSCWDRAIEQTENLLAAKRQLKKGLMQKLLTGKVRFTEFVKSSRCVTTRYGRFPEDWICYHIRDFAKEVSMKNTGEKTLPVLSCTKHDGLVDSLEYFKRQVFSEDTSTYKIVSRGQFAYATNHIEEGSIGFQDFYDEALVSPMYTVFKTSQIVNDHFFYKLLKTELYRHIFEENTSASVDRRGSLRWNEFSRIKVFLPSISEQERITKVLNTCEEEAHYSETKLEALKRQKKGLMQQLLTGITRVKV